MAIGKYDSIYNKLKIEFEQIKEEQSYNNLSLAFAHWFLSNQFNLSDQEIAESIIDGNGDYGIDAVIHNEPEKSLEVFQFKFPSKTETIRKEIPQNDIYKVITGFNYLIDPLDNVELKNASRAFKSLHDELKESEIFNFGINFISFNQGVVDNMEIITNFINQSRKESGIDITYNDYNVQRVSNIFEKMQRQNSIEINLPYKHLQQSYSVNDIDSYIGLINAKQLIESIQDVIGIIFDENIRLAEIKSKVNDGIKQTALGKESSMFYFYNNGITFICDNIQLSPSSLSAKLKGASIVNGCQTVTSLYENYCLDKLNSDVDLLVRVTKISDYDQRAKITQFLNSQNPIKESYFLSNHTIVRDLQNKLLNHNYYLERQINEAAYKEKYIDEDIKKGKKVIKLDDVIQYYSGFYLDKFATTAKRNKASLFSTDTIEEILAEITPEKVIESYEMYQLVSFVITTYRRQRRNKDNEEFANLLGIENSDLDDDESSYLFINTADILLLNACKHILNNDTTLIKNSEVVVKAINIVKDIISNNDDLKSMPPAGLTKSQKIFTELKNKLID